MRHCALDDAAAELLLLARSVARAIGSHANRPHLAACDASYLLLGSRELFLNVAGHFPRSQPLAQIQLSHLVAPRSPDAGREVMKAITTGRTATATFELES